jgi:hypothetical protein
VEPGELDGVNLIPHLKGEIKTPPHDFLAWRWIAQCAIREGNWKLLRGGEREYLYDLSTDLEEKHNLAAGQPEVAARLRAKLEAWSGELLPPGFANGTMAPTWNDYFDHYLEGKTVNGRPGGKAASPGSIQGWLCRNGTLAIQDGALVLTPDANAASNARPFLTHAELNLPGPVTAIVTLRAGQPGDLTLAWRTKDEKDFLPANKATLTWPQKDEPQTLETRLPVTGRLIHLRLQPDSTAGLEIRAITLRGRDGKEQTWSFAR